MTRISSEYDSWHTRLSEQEEQGYALSKIWYQNTINNLPDLNDKKVLEIGCGRGEFSNCLQKKYPEASVVATDFSESAIQICKEKYIENDKLNFRLEDAQALSFEDSSFDFLICCETLEHVPDVKRAVSEIYRVLRKGGGFIITTPSYFNAYFLVWIKCWLLGKPFESGQGVQPFEHFYTFLYIRRILARNKLRVDTSFSTHFQWMVFPRVNPSKLRTTEFKSAALNRIFRPFGTHFFYKGVK